EALRKIAPKPPDVVVLDLMLPHVDGLEICRRLRADEKTAGIPIIMLTARGDESERIVGLELGADDYLAKPFSPNELVARVRALLRRAQRSSTSAAKTLAYGPITLDPDRHTVVLDVRDVTLTAKEFLLLEYLLQHRGRALRDDDAPQARSAHRRDAGGGSAPRRRSARARSHADGAHRARRRSGSHRRAARRARDVYRRRRPRGRRLGRDARRRARDG